MAEPLNRLLAVLVYPGLLSALVVALAVARIARVPAPGGGLTRGLSATLQGHGSFAMLISVLVPLLAMPILPWPGSTWAVPTTLSNLALVWLLLEGSYLLAALPGMSAASTAGIRAAVREVQITAAGRAALWIAIGIGLWAGPWELQTMPGHMLALLAALVALPVAVGWGPFAPDHGTTPGGAEAGLGRSVLELAEWGRAIRASVLLTLIPLLMVPRFPQLHWALNLAITLGGVILLALGGRLMNGATVRRPLLDGIRWCWWRALPVAALAMIALLLGQRWL